MNTIDHEQMPSILLDKIYLYTILSIDTIYILSLFHCQIPLTLLFTPTTYLFNYYTCYIYITLYIHHYYYLTFTNTYTYTPLQNHSSYYLLQNSPFQSLFYILFILSLLQPYPFSYHYYHSPLSLSPKLTTQSSLTYSQLYKYTTTHIFILAYSNTYSYYISILLFVLFIIFRYTNIIHLHTTLKQVNGKPYNSYL